MRLRQDPGCGVAQEHAQQGVGEGYAYRIDKGVDGLGVAHKLGEVVEREGAVLIGEGEDHDEQQRQNHKHGGKDGVRNGPALA